jgi:cyclophilin family peptidyl-prolyl cis-trans isomerase
MRTKFSIGFGLFAIAVTLTCAGCGKSGTDTGQTASNDGKAGVQDAKAPVKEIAPEVVLETDHGPITIRLNNEKSPKTVENFLAYVNSHFYDETIFHQVDKNQAIFGGGYDVNMAGKTPGVKIRNEAHNGLKNLRYTVAMLREQDEIDSATSAFFINVADNPHLDYTGREPENYGFCVFGEVIAGKEVVDRIAAVEVGELNNLPSAPVQKVVLKSAKRIK